MFQNQNLLQEKDIFLLNIEANIEMLQENILFKDLNNYINVTKTNCHVLFYINYLLIQNPYYFLICILKVIFFFIDNFYTG